MACSTLAFQIADAKAAAGLHRWTLDEAREVLGNDLARNLEPPHLVFEGRANRTFNVNIQEVDSITNSPRAMRRSAQTQFLRDFGNRSEISENLDAPSPSSAATSEKCPDSDSLAAPC